METLADAIDFAQGFANLTDAVRWARSHPAEVRAMVSRANAATNLATSVAGMRYYVKAPNP